MAKDPHTFDTTPNELLRILKAYAKSGFNLSGWLTFDELSEKLRKKASTRALR